MVEVVELADNALLSRICKRLRKSAVSVLGGSLLAEFSQLTLFPRWSYPPSRTAWEQRKLGEICEVNPTTVLPDSFEYVDLESVVGTDMISHRREEKLTAPSRAQRLASFGDIFYQTVRPYQKNNYFYELPDKDYVFSTGYAQLRPLCDGRFLFSSLQREQFVFCVLERCTGTSYPAINANDLAALPLAVPNDIEEQRLVGSILKPIDSLVTLHQRECWKALFIRPSAWEQRKLGDCVGSTYGGGTPSTSHDEYWCGDIPWIQSSNVLENELFHIDIPKAITQDGLSKSAALQVPGDSIAVVTHVGVGKLVYLPFPYATSQDFVSLSGLKGDANFLCYAIHRKLQSELHMVQGSAIKGITKEELLGKAISMPAAEEQKLIGNQMRAIDNLITLHQRESSSVL